MHGLTPEQQVAAALAALPQGLLRAPVGVAVSGGSDSLALLKLLQDWAKPRGVRLVALTVDHGLRPEAAAEVEQVAAHCREAATEHVLLRLSDAAPRQNLLRQRRHRVISRAFRAMSGHLLLTGHTADDQAETFLMRARQGSRWYGLAGMRSLSLSPVWPEGEGMFLGRPLLGVRRAELQHCLRQRGLSWATDPSNENPAYERVRMRAMLNARPALFGQVSALAVQFGRLRILEDSALAGWMRDSVTLSEDAFTLRDLGALSPERAARALGLLSQIIAGREMPPRGEALRRLAERVVSEGEFAGATLGGAQLIQRRGEVRMVAEAQSTAPASRGSRAWRYHALKAILSADGPEIESVAGKESFFSDLMPIF